MKNTLDPYELMKVEAQAEVSMEILKSLAEKELNLHEGLDVLLVVMSNLLVNGFLYEDHGITEAQYRKIDQPALTDHVFGSVREKSREAVKDAFQKAVKGQL